MKVLNLYTPYFYSCCPYSRLNQQKSFLKQLKASILGENSRKKKSLKVFRKLSPRHKLLIILFKIKNPSISIALSSCKEVESSDFRPNFAISQAALLSLLSEIFKLLLEKNLHKYQIKDLYEHD